MEEEWRDITGYIGRYQISNLGNVKSLKYGGHNGKIKQLVPKDNGKGYLNVNLLNKVYKIHRLVAQAFIPNNNNLSEIDHIDRNRTNNRADNLRWSTRSENCLNKETVAGKTNEKLISMWGEIFYVQIRRNGKKVYAKGFTTLSEAIIARDSFLAQYQNDTTSSNT